VRLTGCIALRADSRAILGKNADSLSPALVMNTYGHATERKQKDATAAMERVLGA
jgi:hypothetical protein